MAAATIGPFFSIVLTTYNRGRHIVPTIESVLQQSFTDYEVIVVGDGSNEETERVVRSFTSGKTTWRNLPENSGSQSFPNNEGIRNACGRWICYLGHDDIWTADHLARLRAAIDTDPVADFVVSGCVYHGPEGSESYYVTGLFESSDAAFEHFFPPSSLCHRRDVIDRIGEWRDPRSIRPPVDCEFLLRAAHAGLRFLSTGHVTVHKFAAGHRYLFYLRPSSAEQSAMLRSPPREEDGSLQHLLDSSRCECLYMAMRYVDFSRYEPGQLFELNRRNKGLTLPALRPLSDRVVIEQSSDLRGLDWHGLEHGVRPFRWSGPSPHPKILIPFTGRGARIAIQVLTLRPDSDPEQVSAFVEGKKVDRSIDIDGSGTKWLSFFAPLSQSDCTIASLHVPFMFRPDDIHGNGDRRRLGLAAGDIVLEPAPERPVA